MIHLHPDDNVVVCRRAVAAGERIRVGDGRDDLVAASDVEIGHKLACVRIPRTAKVIKYGMSIGSMTHDAAPGEWVHLHNMKSDYLSVHTRSSGGEKQ